MESEPPLPNKRLLVPLLQKPKISNYGFSFSFDGFFLILQRPCINPQFIYLLPDFRAELSRTRWNLFVQGPDLGFVGVYSRIVSAQFLLHVRMLILQLLAIYSQLLKTRFERLIKSTEAVRN